ncbi:MAG: hypothetical protein Q9184_004216 [Pyrenodesmia sp. 2 TL-2023]
MPKEKASSRKTKASKAETGGKKKKDPNAPKRGLSAYMFFANDNRDSVREENPGITFGMQPSTTFTPSLLLIEASLVAGQVGKVLGEKWKALNATQRKPYEARAAADKERYESEKASYNNAAEEEEEEE